jgi:uncharacterized membrane protein
MSSLNKGTIKYALISGLCFAFGMAAFDYLGRVDFNLLKFAFNLLFFGFFRLWSSKTVQGLLLVFSLPLPVQSSFFQDEDYT